MLVAVLALFESTGESNVYAMHVSETTSAETSISRVLVEEDQQ